MNYEKIKLFALICVLCVTFIIGFVFGTVFITTTQHATAATQTVNETQGSISYETVYVNGHRFVVFKHTGVGDIEIAY